MGDEIMSEINDIAMLDATAQAELVQRKEVPPLELVDAAIARIEKLNPALNAVITPAFEQAREIAKKPPFKGLFAGVPFLIKDFLAECAGLPMREGSRFLEGFTPRTDSELVKRYRKAGLITLGKTNTPELAIGVTTEPQLFGPTCNPWDETKIAGGSSGGSAAAVASRIVPMAHGNDAGGSLRIPASCCGVFAIKPTRGRNPLGPLYGDVWGGLVAEHALTLSVRDSAALLDATSGTCPGDPYWAPPPLGPFRHDVGAPPNRLKIGFSHASPSGTEVHPDCVAAVEDAASLCGDLGHHVVEASPHAAWENLWEGFTNMLASGLAWAIRDWSRRLNRPPTPEAFEPFVWSLYERGQSIPAAEYLLHVQNLQRLTRDVALFFDDYDLWLTPTLGTPPPPLGTFAFHGGDPFELRKRMATFSPFTYLGNVTGQPAMSVPLFWNEENLPVGTHFLARFGDEATLFRLAAQLEAARPWASRLPPIAET